MKKFKLGPAKTNMGCSAVITKIDESNKFNGIEADATWWQTGETTKEYFSYPHGYGSGHHNPLSLFPNMDKIEFETTVLNVHHYPLEGAIVTENLMDFAGKKVKVTVEEILE